MSDPTPVDLATQLEEIQAREASFRLQAIQDYRAAQSKIRQLEQEIELARSEVSARDSYVHELHLAQDAARAERESLVRDLSYYVELIRGRDEQLKKLQRRSSQWTEAFSVIARSLSGSNASTDNVQRHAPSAPGVFKYYFHTSPFRIHRSDAIVLKGWCFSEDKRSITAIRARLDDLEFIGRCGLEDPEVTRVHGEHLSGTKPGFEVEIKSAPGEHLLSIEACLDHRDWRTILSTPIWVVS